MIIFKYAIYYTFIGFYQTGIIIKQIPSKLSLWKVNASAKTGLRMKTTLLRTAFRSIL